MKTLRRILSYCRAYRGYLVLTILCTLIGVSLSLTVPVILGKAVDCAVTVGQVDFVQLGKIVTMLAVIVVVSAVFQFLASLFINRLAFGTVKDLRSDLTAHLEKMPVSYIDSHARGDMMARVISDIEILSDGLLQGFAQLFTGIVTILGTLGFMLTMNVKMTLLVVIMTPVSMLAAGKITALTYSAFQKQSELRGNIGALTEELIGNQKLVKSFAYEDRAESRFSAINQELGTAGRKATFFSSVTNPLTRFVNGLIYAVIGTVGALGAIGVFPWIGVMTVGELTGFLAFSNQYTKPFNEISGVAAELQNALSCAKRVFEVLDAPTEPDDSQCEVLEHSQGNLAFQNVSFSYVPEKNLIRNFSMQADSGKRIAVVGPTGCGKSTVINLLLRFYETQSGEIFLDGQSTKSFTRDSLRKQFGMVLQETWIFTGTVAENIAYGKPDATREKIQQAAKSAHAHGFIKRLPNGYDTVISDTSGLSQGQKQLLCIARIMLTNPPMLILDEATSNIDLRTEQRIQKAFQNLMQGKTSFVIAHRLSTIRHSDWILVMKDGNIIEQGTHEMLIQQNGFYAGLYQAQFAG